MSNEERKTLNFKGEHHLARQRRMHREVDRSRQTGNRESESALVDYQRVSEEVDKKMGIKDTDSVEVIALKNENHRAMETIIQLAKTNAAFQNTVNHLVEAWGAGKKEPEQEAQQILDSNYQSLEENKEYKGRLEKWAKDRVSNAYMQPISKPKIKANKK